MLAWCASHFAFDAAGGRCCGLEPALEPPPRDVLGVEHVADVGAGHRAERVVVLLGRLGAVVPGGVRVLDDGADATAVGRLDPRGRVVGLVFDDGVVGVRAVGLAGDQVDRTGGGRTEYVAEGVVGHGVVLRVVPQPRHRVAVEVAHGQAASVVEAGLAGVLGGLLDEPVHEAAVVRPLLGAVVVVLVAGQGLGRREPPRGVQIGVVLPSRPAVRRLLFLGVFFLGWNLTPFLLVARG